MPIEQKAKIFMSGNSQAVRLPKNFRFKGKEVYIRRDPYTREIVLTEINRKRSLKDVLDAITRDPFPEDFMADRNQGEFSKREPL
jgi:antitoxin VapB